MDYDVTDHLWLLTPEVGNSVYIRANAVIIRIF